MAAVVPPRLEMVGDGDAVQPQLLGKHRKLVPTGSERTVWGMGDGSTLPVIDTPHGRLSGLTCWENFMPLARYYLYSQGVDIWAAPTLAPTTTESAATR